MSILNVDKIQPIGGGSTITVDATDIQASTGTIRASTFSGEVSATGIGVTSLNVTGVSTFTGDIDVDGHTNLDNVSIAGVTTITANNVIGLNVENSSGSGAQTTIRSKSTVANASNFVRSESSDNKYIGLLKYGTGHSAYGALAAGGGAVYANSSVPITIMSDGGYINFATGGNTERLRISSAGFVGINSAIPRTYLQVSKGSSGYNQGNPTALNSANVVACFENSDDVEIALLSNNNKKGIIYFGDTDNTANSSIEYDHSINHLLFKVNGGSERFRINNSGAFGLNGTNYGTSGQVLKSGGTNGVPTWGDVSNHTETYGLAIFGAVYDTNSGYIVHNITTGSSNGITIDTTNERVTPTVAGTYLVIYNAHWMGLHSSGATYYNRITKNGSEYISSNFSAYDPGSHMHTVMTTIDMNGSSDYIQFEFYENKSGAAAYVNHKSRAVVILLDT